MYQRIWGHVWPTLLQGQVPQGTTDQEHSHIRNMGSHGSTENLCEETQRQIFLDHVDNEAVASILNTGASRETELQNTLREIGLIAAENQFVIKARHIAGVSNRIPDWLLRWADTKSKREFRKFTQDKSLKQIRVYRNQLQYVHTW